MARPVSRCGLADRPLAAIALVTCSLFPDGDSDDAGLPDALGGAEWIPWDAEGVDWAAYDIVVIRSPWDYMNRHDRFISWAESVPRLVNPAPVLRWNTDKRYLQELAAAGLPVVPTAFAEPGATPDLPSGPFVVKPTVSGGAQLTARFEPGEQERARGLAASIHAKGKTVMVQSYVESVDERGETALMYFGGEYSHAIGKGAILKPGAEPTDQPFAAEDTAPREPTQGEREVAEAVLDATIATGLTGGAPLPYARVDLVEDAGGSPALLELEVTEPSLFFRHAGPEAVARFARAVVR